MLYAYCCGCNFPFVINSLLILLYGFMFYEPE
jgi:hypothetical protein